MSPRTIPVSLSLFFAYLAVSMLVLAAGAVHLLRGQARVVVRRSSVVNVLLPVSALAGLYALVG